MSCLLVMADVHSNLAALEAVLADVDWKAIAEEDEGGRPSGDADNATRLRLVRELGNKRGHSFV